MTGPLRTFVPPSALSEGRLNLSGDDVQRLRARGARTGQTVVALDQSGWEYTVVLEALTAQLATGRMTGRRLAAERRTKVSLYQALLHPSDFRRLLTRATELGVVAFVPVIADGSIVPLLDASGQPEGGDEWPRLVRDAAEQGVRGQCPTVGPPMLVDHALDEAARHGTVLMVSQDGRGLDEALAERPFSLSVFCPPPGGFTADEVARAQARAVVMVAPPVMGPDPILPALALLTGVYDRLEGATA